MLAYRYKVSRPNVRFQLSLHDNGDGDFSLSSPQYSYEDVIKGTCRVLGDIQGVYH